MTKWQTVKLYCKWFLNERPHTSFNRYRKDCDFKINKAKINGKCLVELDKVQDKKHVDCTHRKGGLIAYGETLIPDFNSDRLHDSFDFQYAVIKHKFANGDIWVICKRCGKKWKPGCSGYEEALKFPTAELSKFQHSIL